MSPPALRLYFDFVDPLSYVASVGRARALSGRVDAAEWVGFEVRPPPARLTGWDEPSWARRLAAARGVAPALGLTLRAPALVPWSRKAHELYLFAHERGRGHAVRAAIFEAFFGEARDIGRVDVLVEIAAATGLDRTETKAVLDVDRYQDDVLDARRRAEALGVEDVPCHSVAESLLRGFPDPAVHGTLLPDP